MPTPLRRSGSGLLQNPWPGLLPSPNGTGLGPSRVSFSTRQGSTSLRPAALLHLPSAPPLSGYRRFHYRAPLAACPGRTFTGWSPSPCWAVLPFKKVDRSCHSASDDRLTRGSGDIRSDPVATIPAHDPGPPLLPRPLPARPPCP